MFCDHCGKKLVPDSAFCVYCGRAVERSTGVRTAPVAEPVPVAVRAKKRGGKLQGVSCVLSVILCLSAMFFIMLAMNFQDLSRNENETLSPTAVYTVLLLVLAAFLAVSLICHRLNKLWIPAFVSLLLPVMVLFSTAQGSVYAAGFINGSVYTEYINADTVAFCNGAWIVALVLATVASWLPLLAELLRRSDPYETIARLHRHCKDGALTEEEFERAKQDILKEIR